MKGKERMPTLQDLPTDILEKGVVYDIETFKNFFSCTAYSLRKEKWKSWVISDTRDDRAEMFNLLKGRYLIGFNNGFFDDCVLEAIFRGKVKTPEEIYNFAQQIIEGGENPFRFCNKFFDRSYDLLEVIRAGYATKPLKGVAVNLKYPKIQDLPYSPHDKLTPEQQQEVLEYNKNDVLMTIECLKSVAGKLTMRDQLSKLFKVDLHSASDSAIAKICLNKWYSEKIGCEQKELRNLQTTTDRESILCGDIVYDYINFETQQLQDYLNLLKSKVIYLEESSPKNDKYSLDIPSIKFYGTEYTIGLGGIHSKDEALIRYPKDDEMLLDLDVASQYPTAILNNQLCPKHLESTVFLPLLQEIVDNRLYHKKRKEESSESNYIQEGLKITVNSIYGLLNSKTFWLFDPQITFTVTINNQLMILMLIEKLELAGYNVISANTDGIVIDDFENNLEDIRRIYKEWEKLTDFELEETFYDTIVRRDVNNYMAKPNNGDLKVKGLFEPQGGLIKGFVFPVIAKALQAYFLDGVDPQKFLENHEDIYDFCHSQKVGSQFTHILEKVERETEEFSYKTGKKLKNPRLHYRLLKVSNNPQEVQKTVRYYVTPPYKKEGHKAYGYRLRKRKTENGKYKYTDYVAGWFVHIFNDYSEDRPPVDYSFYLQRIWNEIEKIQQQAKPDNKNDSPEQLGLSI